MKDCEAYKKLLKLVEKDIETDSLRNKQDYEEKLNWIIKRAEEYADILETTPCEILTAWEKQRNYWYMNYYQETNQPSLKRKDIYIFKNKEEFFKKYNQFICPNCGEIIKDPQECYKCGWKSYGLFGTLGKGIYILLKDKIIVIEIFRPVKLEQIKQKGKK